MDRGRPSAVHGLLRSVRIARATRRPTHPVNVGLISGGRSVNAIAAEAELIAEMRALDEPPLDAFATAADPWLRKSRSPWP